MRPRAVVLVAVGLLVATTLAGCAPPVACSAVGYTDTLVVRVSGPGSDTAVVQVCQAATCSAVPTAPTPDPSAPPTAARREDDGDWDVSGSFDTSRALTVRALDTTGTVLAETTTRPAWHRVGGTAQCGGPRKAGPIRLTIPG
jgi:hypothetical protein